MPEFLHFDKLELENLQLSQSPPKWAGKLVPREKAAKNIFDASCRYLHFSCAKNVDKCRKREVLKIFLDTFRLFLTFFACAENVENRFRHFSTIIDVF